MSLLTVDKLQQPCPYCVFHQPCPDALPDSPDSELVGTITINHSLRRVINSHIPPEDGEGKKEEPNRDAERSPKDFVIPCSSPFLQFYCIAIFGFHEIAL